MARLLPRNHGGRRRHAGVIDPMGLGFLISLAGLLTSLLVHGDDVAAPPSRNDVNTALYSSGP